MYLTKVARGNTLNTQKSINGLIFLFNIKMLIK